MSCGCVCASTEIQELKPTELRTLGDILNYSGSWKRLMAIVPRDGSRDGSFRFNNEHISVIERAAETDDRNAAEIFVEEWSTMGKKAPSVGLLLDLLIKAELFRAADYVACDILKREKPKRPDNGPAASIDVNDSIIDKLLEEQQTQHDASTDLILESASKLVFNQEVYPSNKADNDMNNPDIANLPDIADNLFNCEKTTNEDSIKTVSDFMKFSNTCEAVNNHVEHTVASTIAFDSAKVEEKIIRPVERRSEVAAHYYECKEVSSQELPAVLNNSKQSDFNSETCNSTNIPLCIKDLSLA